jgi:hypothetical protein
VSKDSSRLTVPLYTALTVIVVVCVCTVICVGAGYSAHRNKVKAAAALARLKGIREGRGISKRGTQMAMISNPLRAMVRVCMCVWSVTCGDVRERLVLAVPVSK